MNITLFGTLKKYNNRFSNWYSILVRQNGKTFYINAYFKEGEPIPNENHKLHLKARGKLFSDKRTRITRLSLYDTEVIEDLGIDEIEILNERKDEVSLLADSQKFDIINDDNDDLPW